MAEQIREIVMDTETTGLDPSNSDRVIEIGCVEMINHSITGKTFHTYLNPEGKAVGDSYEVHKLSDVFLSDKPKFIEVAQDFLDFIGDSILIFHNAPFDIPFLNMELARIDKAPLSFDRVIDTLDMSRRKNPHLGRHNLDSLCKRYDIDLSSRDDAHGALIDSKLLAEVYIALIGGREAADFFKANEEQTAAVSVAAMMKDRKFRPARDFPISEDELAAHDAFVEKLGDKAIWKACS